MFLAQPDLAASSCRSSAQTLGRLGREVGPERPLEWVSGRGLERAVMDAWGGCAPATWNRHIATVRSFEAFCVAAAGWPSRLPRRWRAGASPPIGPGRFRTLSSSGCGAATTSRCARRRLWRLLYETAARAGEVLSLNVEDLDLENKRARAISKGGDVEWLHLQAGSARLLPRLVAARAARCFCPTGAQRRPGRPLLLTCVSGHRAGTVVLPPR
jgi:integrase